MIFSPFKRHNFVMPCEQCDKTETVTFALPTVNKIDGNDFEIVPLWHCSGCNILFDGLTPSVTSNPEIAKRFRFTPAVGISQAMMNDVIGLEKKVHKNRQEFEKDRVNISDSTEKQIHILREKVVNFKLK